MAHPTEKPLELLRIPLHDAGRGYDLLGACHSGVRTADRWLRPLYRHYFRVASEGAQSIPASGPVVVVANHGGMLPLDAFMLWRDLLVRTGRLPRIVADLFVDRLPFVATASARMGVVAGTRAAFEWLLRAGELLLVFPEGVPGVAKTSRERYQLRPFRVGPFELALRHRAAIVTAAIVGAEEAWPVAFRIDRWHPIGAPYVPIPWCAAPLPIRFRIRYGPPQWPADERPDDAWMDPALLARLAGRARDDVDRMVRDLRRGAL